MRWLLIKDLRILRRSPLLVALLMLYPVVVAVLIGAALTGGPEKPRVAFANLAGDAQFSLGGADARRRHLHGEASSRPSTRSASRPREEAIAKVRDGEALAALVIPADATERLQSMLSLAGGEPPTVEVFYNAEDPVKRRYVESTIRAAAGRGRRGAQRRGARPVAPGTSTSWSRAASCRSRSSATSRSSGCATRAR